MRKIRIACFLLALLLLISACGSAETPPEETSAPTEEPLPTEAPPVYEYTEPYVRLMEPCGSGFVIQKNVLQIEVGAHTYRFEPSIGEQARNGFIAGQEALCRLLDDNGIRTDGLCFFVFPDYPNWTDSANAVAYYGLNAAKSWQQALTTVQLARGDYSNYGWLYALSDHLAWDLGWTRDETSETDNGIVDGTLLNLVYPCFDGFYSSPEDIAACKALSKELMAGLDDIWSEEDFLQARERYAEEKGIDFAPTYLAFAYYSPSCKLKTRGMYLEFFRTNSFTEDRYYTLGYIDEDYMATLGGMIRGIGWLEDYLTQLRDTFGIDDPSLLPVYLNDDAGRYADITYAAYFEVTKDGGRITGVCVPIMAHEYVHYLYWLRGGENDSAYEDWINEVVACYYNLPGDFEITRNYYEKYLPELLEDYTELTGEDYDDISDYIRLLRIYYRTAEDVKPYRYYLISDYDLRPVFGDYFVRTYGEEVFLEWALHPSRVRQLTGKTTSEIISDWCEDMDNPENDLLYSLPAA
ncbi:MAG: hypothetical protein IK149_01380 [Oscillospiraceae bacterium]|nr:hypothetical protein [Oscillospiraceae bacterium]